MRTLAAVLVVVVQLAAGAACAQTYPTRTITLVVPFAAGGPTDTIARLLAERMRPTLGQAIVIENVAGASGTTAGARVARAVPDGHTLIIGQWGTHVLAGAVHALSYDVARDFEPIALLANGPQLVIVRKTLPVQSLSGLVDWLKANPGKATAGTAGPGSGAHVSGVYFKAQTGTDFTFVPYRGAGPALNDLMAGHIDVMFDQAANALAQVRGGTITALAVTAPARLAAAPDIPTVDEAGLPGLYIDFWHGLWAPKGTRAEIIDTLNRAVVAALAEADVRQRLSELGQVVPGPEQLSPQALRALQQSDIAKWWPIVKAGEAGSTAPVSK